MLEWGFQGVQQLQPVLGMWAWRYSWDGLGAELNPAEEFLSEEPGDSPVPTLTPCPEHSKHLRRGSSLGVHQITLERRKKSSFLAKKKKKFMAELPRAWVEFPSLEGLKSHQDVALGDRGWVWTW